MPKFAANLSMLFTEHPFLERFALARRAGFEAIEFLFPYEFDIDAIKRELQDNDLELVLFNLPAGNFAAGDRGLANDPRRVSEFRESVALALNVASELQPGRLNCLTGLRLDDVPDDEQHATLIENLRYAASAAADAGVRQVFEPLNVYDAPGYFVTMPEDGFSIVEAIDHPNLALQYDIYHAQRMRGNLAETIANRIGLIGHVQIADSPARHEPGTGEIHYPFVLEALDAAGYDGWVSLEYRPKINTTSSLAWLREMGYWPHENV